MRGMPYRERLLVANLMRLLGASTVATLGVVLVLVYGRKSGKNDLSFFKTWLSP